MSYLDMNLPGVYFVRNKDTHIFLINQLVSSPEQTNYFPQCQTPWTISMA